MASNPMKYKPTEAFARELDAADPLAKERSNFLIPPSPANPAEPSIYLVGNSLGCQPKRVRELLNEELDDWANLGVEGHLDSRRPWFSYHEQFRETGARLVGAKPGEVVMMNGLTPNLHLMMVSFYRPTENRFKIVIEDTAFPSDSYAVQSQADFHGFDPGAAIIRLRPREGEHTLRDEDILEVIRREGDSIALVMLGGVNYLTGQFFDIESITRAGHEAGAVVGWDLAHAAGNVPLRLHDWGADFACWCSYKYLNAGPGAIAGCFVHERHGSDPSLKRFAGWWGNDPESRFIMKPGFAPRQGADGWQLCNPPIFAMAPLLASLEIFDRVGMDAIRHKSERLTGFMEFLIDGLCAGRVTIRTPREPHRRGAQLSLVVPGSAKAIQKALHARGVFADFREPDVIRVAPAPLYNSFADVYRFVSILSELTAE